MVMYEVKRSITQTKTKKTIQNCVKPSNRGIERKLHTQTQTMTYDSRQYFTDKDKSYVALS